MTNTSTETENKDDTSKQGLYLYGIVTAGKDLGFLKDIKGLSDVPVKTVKFQDLEAIVSDVSGTRQKATRDNLLRHAAVLDQIIEHEQVLPFRFGLIADNEDDIVNKLLKPHYDEFSQTLKKLENKEEVGLKVYWNEKAILNDIVNSNETIRNKRDELVAKGNESSAAIHQEKIDLGRLVEQEVTNKRDSLKQETVETLQPLAEDFRENKLLSDNMVLNAAFLVPIEKEQEFTDRLKQLDEKHHEFLTFRFVPVAPPFNFVNLNVSTEAT